jgi:endonuclease/exonuclease/phosphatase family metal-dependent hydrolase
MSALRILSYNTQLRSWAMEVGWPPSIPPTDTAEERAGFIADNILASTFDYDVVGLCEVFDEDAREILRDRLRSRFPHIVAKSDWDYVQVEESSPSLSTIGLFWQWPLLGTPAVSSSWRLEDSGLMLFSKFPFAQVPTSGLSPAVVAAAAVLGYPVPAVAPAVSFFPFEDTAGNDGNAAKGVVYARLQPQFGDPMHVFLSHTQADSESLEEHRSERSTQIAKVEKFIDICTGGAPFTQEVFFMGDLNISGELESDAVAGKEWQADFGTAGRLLGDAMVDLWGRRQCTGAPGLRDRGLSATVTYPPRQQRLDYMFASTTSGFAAQHVMIDYDLADVPPGNPGVSYLSDHRPLRLELARPRSHSTPADAFVVPPDPAIFATDEEWLVEGQAMWFRFDRAGTYDFRLDQQFNPLAFSVYLDTDLSRPRQQYRMEKHPDFGDKFVIAAPPFLVKVFPLNRGGEAQFRFHAHRHEGIAPWDAIQLPYGEVVPEAFPLGQLLNTDMPDTDWDDTDTKWFRLDGPVSDLGRPVEARIDVRRTGGTSRFSVATAVEGPPSVWTLLDRADDTDGAASLTAALAKGDVVYVQVTRHDLPGLGALEFDVTATTNATFVLGGPYGAPRLVCTDETSGWGSDDIELGVTVDGKELVYIDNDAIGDFDQDAIRDLNQWLPPVFAYFAGVEFMVKELDDIGHDDIGRETLRPFADLAGWDRFEVTDTVSPGRVRGQLRVDVDDGRYDVELAVTTWDEKA